MIFLLLSTYNDFIHLPDTQRGTWNFYLNHAMYVCMYTHSNSFEVIGWVGSAAHGHETLVTAKSPLLDLNPGGLGIGLWTGSWTRAS